MRARLERKLARHRGGVLEGPAPARRLRGRRLWLADERLRSIGDAADRAGASDGALQLIARLNGKRSPVCPPSACGHGVPPPDHGPAPDGRRHCARSAGTDVSGLAPAPAAGPWLRFG